MGRRLAVWVSAWAMRRGMTLADITRALNRAYPHRDASWQGHVLADARERNRARLMKRINA